MSSRPIMRPVATVAALLCLIVVGCAGTPSGTLPPVSGPGQAPGGAGAAAGVEVQPLGPGGQVQALPPGGSSGPASATPSRNTNPAVLALLDSADQQAASGDLERASATLERALRIDPQDATIWHDLGTLRMRQGDLQQAQSLAQRSNSLASGDTALQARNWRLIERARRAQGNVRGADEAAAQAVVLERR